MFINIICVHLRTYKHISVLNMSEINQYSTISLKNIQKIMNVSRWTASRRLSKLKKDFKKQKYDKVLIIDFCNFYNYDFNVIKTILTPKK